ncbi:MFS transporter [Variovorax boronicumulans]|uniref:MFS transporter n=1 Tax=Variovorax boronicumulans TaxID=436515 RepID=UPI001C583D56
MTSTSDGAAGLSGRVVALMALSCALAVSTIYYHQPLLPLIASSFGVPSTQASLIATLTQLGYAIGLLLIVPLADRQQPRKLASLAVAANAFALLACAAAPSFALLCIASFAVGVTAITAQIIIPTVSGLAPPALRGRTAGILLGGLSAGLLLARTASGFVGAATGWRTVFLAAALVDLGLWAIVARKLPAVSTPTSLGYGALLRSLGRLVREERVLRISAATAFMMFAAFSALWATLAALLAQPPYGFGPAAIGAFGLVALLGIAASPRIGALADRLDARALLLARALALALGFAFIAAGGRGLGWLIAGMVLLDFGNRTGLVANQTRVYALRPEARSRLNTVFMGAYFLGGSAGAALGAYGAHRAGWAGLAATGALLALAAAAINMLSLRAARAAVVDGTS